MTVGNLIDFVMNNRRGKAFNGWTPIQLADSFLEAIESNLLFYSVDNGEVVGVVHAGKFGNTIHVYNILTTRAGVLQQFVQRLTELHPGCELDATRHERIKHYDAQRFIKKVLHYG
jgi:RNA binding exosome subunit